MMYGKVQLPTTRRPIILPVVASPQENEEAYPGFLAPLLVTALAQRVAQTRFVQLDAPVAVNELTHRLTHHIDRGVKDVLLLPWCLQYVATDLIDGATRALRQTGEREVGLSTLPRPTVAVHGVLPIGPLGGFIPVQERLDRLVALVPGWHAVYTCLRSEQATFLVPLALLEQQRLCRQSGEDLAAQLEMGLCAALCPDHFNAEMSLRDERPCRWRQDGPIYVAYLAQLLCGALDSACSRSQSPVRQAITPLASA
jgi:hypothetical protein